MLRRKPYKNKIWHMDVPGSV